MTTPAISINHIIAMIKPHVDSGRHADVALGMAQDAHRISAVVRHWTFEKTMQHIADACECSYSVHEDTQRVRFVRRDACTC